MRVIRSKEQIETLMFRAKVDSSKGVMTQMMFLFDPVSIVMQGIVGEQVLKNGGNLEATF